MAGTYGLDGGGNVVIQEPASSGSGPATRLTGGDAQFQSFGSASFAQGGNFGAVGDSSFKTLEALNKLASGVLSPIIEAEQKRQYFNGMAEVAQGRTLLEVQKDQPWFTQIFGPSASVQGAQAMTIMGAMSQAETEFYQALPELSKQSPDAMRAWLGEQAAKVANTGDPTMDAMIQGRLAEQIGPMMGQHIKQHIKYVQEQNNTAYGNAIVTSGEALQRKAELSGFFSPEDLELETQRALEVFKPLPGMTPDAWQSNTVKGLQASMMSGNFSIYEAFKTTEEYKQLPVEIKGQLEYQILPYAQAWSRRHSPSYRDQAYDVVALGSALKHGQGPATLEALDSWMDEQDKKFAVQSGSSRPLFDNNARASMYQSYLQGQEYLARKQAAFTAAVDKANAQVLDDAAQQGAVLGALKGGPLPAHHSKIEPENVQTALDAVFHDAIQNGGEAAVRTHIAELAVLSNNGSKYMNQRLATSMTTAAGNFLKQGMPVSDSMKDHLRFMTMMVEAPNGIQGLSNYIGADNAKKILALMNSGVDLDDSSALDVVRTSIERGWGAPVTKEIRKAVKGFLSDEDGFFQKYLPLGGPGALTGYDLNAGNKQRLISLLEPTVARLVAGNGLSTEQAAPLAFSLMFDDISRVDFVDGSFTQPGPASGFRSMFSVVSESRSLRNQADTDYQQAVRNVINNAMIEAVASVPPPEPRERSRSEKVGDVIVGVVDKVMKDVPGLGYMYQGRDGRDAAQSPFNPEAYETASLTTFAEGYMAVHRVPKEPSPTMRPVTVYISADQVIAEFDDLVRQRAEDARRLRELMPEPDGFLYN